MSGPDMYSLAPLTEEQKRQVLEDLATIIRGEELALPWRRVRRLLDHGLIEVTNPVITQESNHSLTITNRGYTTIDVNDYSVAR
ncbi:hypothetical protein GCM10011491_41560 [Brucella endophytica]|uniref:Uncharacterized protein n=1 Tax=Brucella endophytica TaxID=1963359 RepID=A0A916SQZ6_9HYPH|nr:hypothetical protein [Brucella endophytica]GGB09275.1 hypothetical protein GCM10011491_41560 [Brucella endophytica]